MTTRATPRYLVVRAKDTALRIALPELGSLTIGRAVTSDVRIRENGVESEHAVLYLDHGIGIRVLADDSARLELRPGKPAKERPFELGRTTELELGDHVRLGSAELVFVSAPSIEPRVRAVPPAFFERRLELERARGELAVLRFRVEAALEVDALEAALSGCLRPADVLTSLGPHDLAVLIPGATDAVARARLAEIAESLLARGGEVLSGLALAADGASRLAELAAERLARSIAADRPRELLARDPAMQDIARLVERVSKSAAPVLVLGETGVGKDLIAQMIHDRSDRAGGPFVRVNCVDLSDAFLDGDSGLLAKARGGTVHLDEIGGLSPRAQLSLGHLLDQAPSAAQAVRFIASSNQDLAQAVAAGEFRKDLFFRLNPLTLHVPPLRERRADVVPLAEHFVEQATRAAKSERLGLTAAAKTALEAYAWPGNVRELRNAIERAVLLSGGGAIGVEHLPSELSRSAPVPPPESPAAAPTAEPDRPRSLREEIEALEKKRILEALQKYPTQRDAAAALDMPMRTFLNRLDQFGIPRARGGGSGNKSE